jgi:hypothetical protein
MKKCEQCGKEDPTVGERYPHCDPTCDMNLCRDCHMKAAEDESDEIEKCSDCEADLAEDAGEGYDGKCGNCADRAERAKALAEFEPVTLTVVDIVATERTVVITSPFCPNCNADLREGVTLQQYQYSEQGTDLTGDSWGGVDHGDGYFALAYTCGECDEPIASGSEKTIPADAPVPS